MKITYKGVEYGSKKALAETFGINPHTFSKRYNSGMTIEEALSKKSYRFRNGSKKCQDHLGNWYENQKIMARHYKIPYPVYKSRKRMGWSLKDILTKPPKRYTPSNGEEFHDYELEEMEEMEGGQYNVRDGNKR